MFSHTIETSWKHLPQEAQRRYWAEDGSYGDYMNSVDDLLEELIGRASEQEELEMIAQLQEERCLPSETAWIIAKESFSRPWKFG